MNKNNQTDTAEDGYTYKLVKSAAPFYAAGICWIAFALILPLYKWYHYLLAAALSIAIFWLFGKIFPPKKVKVITKRKAVKSGVPDVDKLIRSAEANLKSVNESRRQILRFAPEFERKIAALENYGYKILSYISENPDKISLLRRFVNYYLPALEKLLRNYIVFHNDGMDGRDVTESMREIEDAVSAMQGVFEKQLEKLFSDRVLDISTDIDVLENMLSRDGININGSNDLSQN